jgi:hypothetical protein
VSTVPIKITLGVELTEKGAGISAVNVTQSSASKDLSWDRFVRLKAAAAAVEQSGARNVLDVGGYDGALGFFLPGVELDVIDPATTGGSILQIAVADGSYDAVVGVDVLEHIEPSDRAKALSEFARIARSHVIMNYPCKASKAAQELALKLTNNALIKEHVQWDLPDSDWVLAELGKFGYRGVVTPHTSIAVWLGQYVTLNLLPDVAPELNRYLVSNCADEPTANSLYHLIVCQRI